MAVPHVLIFPLPLQDPVNCMLKLAELLCFHQEIYVTFINTEYIHHRLLNYTDVLIRLAKYPNFKFVTVPDGLPGDNLRNGEQVWKMIEGVEEMSSPPFREMLMTTTTCSPTCLIVDGIFTLAVDIAKEAKIPLLYFDTISPCAVWTYLAVPKLIEAGDVPFKGKTIFSIFAKHTNVQQPMERGYELYRLAQQTAQQISFICQHWKPCHNEQGPILGIWYGLVNSKTNFLWVQRPGSIIGLEDDDINVPMELVESIKERSCIVSWAPQEEVLAHPSIGGFLTLVGGIRLWKV
ncbi:hypothetical protein RDI58_007477 [Solanum bulbocastanum]|uniref:Uncharacterized protein n=1 Tax=Solanum bulbocastanum TaxID=147425 RepID=A0AAN8TV47_SOLBU